MRSYGFLYIALRSIKFIILEYIYQNQNVQMRDPAYFIMIYFHGPYEIGAAIENEICAPMNG